mgnify:CR=1 FL=1
MILTCPWTLWPQYYLVVVRPPTTGDALGAYIWQTKPAYLNPWTHLIEVLPCPRPSASVTTRSPASGSWCQSPSSTLLRASLG